MSDMFTSKTRRAAKVHSCGECGKEIGVGERYSAWFQLFEGDAFSGKQCLRCQDMRSTAWEIFDWFDPEEAAPWGELRSYIQEEHGIADVEAWFDGIVAEREAKAAATELIEGAVQIYGGGLLH